jgi:hypothetical protein
MNKITLILLWFALFCSSARAQNDRSKFRLLLTSSEIDSLPSQTIEIKKIRHSCKNDSILVKTQHKAKKTFADKDVWGYQQSNGDLYRNCYGSFFKVEVQSRLMTIYSKKSRGFKGRVITTYFFSKGLDSGIYYLNRESIDNQYKHNPCILQRTHRKLKWPLDCAWWDNKNANFKIVKILNACGG